MNLNAYNGLLDIFFNCELIHLDMALNKLFNVN